MLKRSLVSLLTCVMLLSVAAANVYGAELPLRILVNNEQVYFPDAAPFLDSNARIQVPVRFVSEALNATVDWDKNTREVTVTRKDTVVKLKIDNKNMTVNGNSKVLDTAPVIQDGRTFVPVRFVSEALGASVDWKANISTVYIDLDEKTADKPAKYNVGGFDIDIADNDKFTFNNSKGRRIEKESRLYIDESGDPDNHPAITLLLQRSLVGADVNKQLSETRVILSQKIEAGCLDQIMNYISTATDVTVKLPHKWFEDSNYEISINAASNSPIGILVYAKK